MHAYVSAYVIFTILYGRCIGTWHDPSQTQILDTPLARDTATVEATTLIKARTWLIEQPASDDFEGASFERCTRVDLNTWLSFAIIARRLG